MAALSGALAATSHKGRWYVLVMMTAVYAVNIADRYVVSTLIEPIKAELALSDASVGFLTGVALAIFYVSAGIPLGVLADRTNRRNMIAISLAAWSFMTMLCGLAQNFWQLLLARIGVGIGEAGGTPPSQSIIADRYPARIRAAAMSIFAVGAAIGATLGSTGGGWLSDHYGWRMALFIFGIAGLPFALLVWLTVAEPKRGQLDARGPSEEIATLSQTLAFVRSQKALMHVLAGSAVITYWGWGTLWWTPSFLVRSHGLSVGEAGALLGPMHGVGGTAIMLLSAWIMHRLAHQDLRYQTWFVAATTLLAVTPSLLAYSASSLQLATLMLWLFVPVIYLYLGPTAALLQNLVPCAMRSQVFAIFLFLSNFANLVVAPQLIGIASDLIGPRIDDPRESLRYVLMVNAVTGLWAAWHYMAAAKELRQNIARAEGLTAQTA